MGDGSVTEGATWLMSATLCVSALVALTEVATALGADTLEAMGDASVIRSISLDG